MNLPIYLSQTPNPLFLNQLETHSNIKLKAHSDTLKVSFPTSLKEKVTLIVTSDVKYKMIELDFPVNSLISIYIVYHFWKNAELQVNYHLAQESNVKIVESFLSSKLIKSNIQREFELHQRALMTLSSGIFMDGEHHFKDEIHLKEELAVMDYDTLSIGSKQDYIESVQEIRHQAKNTTSNVHNLIVSNDKSKIEFFVNGYIDKGMSGSNCKQQNRGVILTEQGIVRVDPKLFIEEYDVEAGHGAAIGQINEDEMFYLLSRGLSENEAKRLILSGYTEPFVLSLDEGALKKTVNHRIAKKVKGE